MALQYLSVSTGAAQCSPAWWGTWSTSRPWCSLHPTCPRLGRSSSIPGVALEICTTRWPHSFQDKLVPTLISTSSLLISSTFLLQHCIFSFLFMKLSRCWSWQQNQPTLALSIMCSKNSPNKLSHMVEISGLESSRMLKRGPRTLANTWLSLHQVDYPGHWSRIPRTASQSFLWCTSSFSK